MFDGHVGGLGLALQDLDGHLAGDLAEVLVVDGEGEQAAGHAHALLAGDEGKLVLLADLTHLGGAGRDGVVGGGVKGVHLAHRGLHNGLDLVGAGDGVLGVLQAQGVELVLGSLDLDVGVGLGGAIEQTDLLHVGQDLLHHLELLGHGREVRGAGDVGAGLVVVLDQAGGGKVSDGGAHDGDVGRGAGGSLGGRRGDGKDQVHAVAHELGGDGLAGGLVVLGVLLVDGDGEAGGVDGLDEALVGGVQGSVLGQLDHADLVGLLAGGRAAVGRAVGRAAAGQDGGGGNAGARKEVPSGDVHVLLPLLDSNSDAGQFSARAERVAQRRQKRARTVTRGAARSTRLSPPLHAPCEDASPASGRGAG